MLKARLRSSAVGRLDGGGGHRSRCLATITHVLYHAGMPIALPTTRLGRANNSRPHCGILGAKAVRSSSCRRLVKTAAAEVADIQTYEDAAGPAFKDTLKMLEWHRLREHLAKHASTAVGKRMCLNLEVPIDMPSSVRLLNETRAMFAMENEYMSLLDYGGINTSDAEGAIKRAAKGGMVSGKQLRGLVAMLQGADRLKRQIQLVARQNNVTNKDSPIWPLLAAVAAVSTPKGLMRDIAAAVNEDGQLADGASEQVRTTRGKVQGITSRINNILKGYPGEASENSGRLCVAVPAGTKITNGVMLGSSIGGGIVYIEPAQVVSQNNELAAARAEAMAAEENVLWELSGRVMGVQDDVEMAFNVVGWLDLLSAKVRFGMWLGAVMPEFTPWDDVFHKRSGSAINKVRQQQHGEDDDPSPINWDNFAAAGAAAAGAVHLRKFSHPLLLADFLEQQQQLELQQRQQSGAAASSSGGSSRKTKSRMLGTRKEVINMQNGNGSNGSSSSSSDVAVDLMLEDQLRDLQPPRTIDLVIQPETSVVVITGPNTGGKTATMKAFGLAVCMSKAGLLIPAAAPARVPCYTSVLADVGDEQSLTANLSTFSGHIKRISALRAEADGRSLLLLDELGTGTDPTEGAALGLALLKQLINGGIGNGALTIATTHHSIMTSLKFDDPRAENASVEFDEQALAPTYKLLWGVPGRSNALNIAARLGLQPSIIAAARQRLSAGVAAANEAIQELEVAQDELKQADLAAFAVEADVKYTKDRLQEVKNLVLTAQQELALKRSAAIQEVGSAARELLRALKQERMGRQKGKPISKISRQLSMALGNDDAEIVSGDDTTAKVQSLDDAIKSFNALSTNNSKYDTVWDVQQRQLQQQAGQQLQAEEAWVRAWRKLADRARWVLQKSLAPSSTAADRHRDVDAESSADIDMEIEFELQKHNARAAAREAKQQQQVMALQQMVDEVAAQRREQISQASTDEQVSEELFATGVSLVEQALESDQEMQQLQQKLQQQQAMAAAAEKARAEEATRKQAEDAALISSMESELDTWYLEQIAAHEQRQQQEREAAAAAAAAAAEARRHHQSADFDAIAAFEDMMLDQKLGSSSSSNSSVTAGGLHKRPAAKQHMPSAQPDVQQRQQVVRMPSSSNSDNSGSSSSLPAIESDALGGDLELLLDSLDFDSLLPAADLGAPPQQQQKQQQQQRKQRSKQPSGKQKGKPAMKFRLS